MTITITDATPAVHPSPTAAAYARLCAIRPGLTITEYGPRAELPDGEGWVSGAELAAVGPALGAFLARDAEEMLREHGRRPRLDVLAGIGLHRYLWPAALLFTVPWFLDRRVPHLTVADVTVRHDAGHLAVRTGTFACLPDDPAAALPGARVVAGEEALRTELLAALTVHLRPLLDRFGPLMRRRSRGPWGMATDDVTEGLWFVGRMLGEERRARAELALLLPGDTPPFAGAAAFRELRGPGTAALPTRDRVTCCLFYTLRPEATCDTCPRTCDAERMRRRGTDPAG